MDDFEKYRKASGQIIERKIKGELFKFKPLKGEDLWKLLNLSKDVSDTKNLTDDKFILIKELGFKMMRSADENVPDDILKEFIEYNILEVLFIIMEINFGIKELKDMKIENKLERLRTNVDTRTTDTPTEANP